MGNPFSHPQPATNHILVHDVATQNSLGYRSPDVELEDLELQLKHPDLPHWHNLHSPDKVKVYLLTTVDDHWALFIDLTNQSRFATCGEFEFSGLICNLGIESTQSRRLVLMMLTLPSNSSAIDPYLRLFTKAILLGSLPVDTSDMPTCALLALKFSVDIETAFTELALSDPVAHPKSAPAGIFDFKLDSMTNSREFESKEYEAADYWDAFLNCKTFVAVACRQLGLELPPHLCLSCPPITSVALYSVILEALKAPKSTSTPKSHPRLPLGSPPTLTPPSSSN